jgi:hypothetical protein
MLISIIYEYMIHKSLFDLIKEETEDYENEF